MTHYDQFCANYKENFDFFIQYKLDCVNFLEVFCQAIIKEFDIPEGSLVYYDWRKQETSLSAASSLQMIKDSYWKIILCIQVEVDEDIYPKQLIMVGFFLKKIDETFEIYFSHQKSHRLREKKGEFNFDGPIYEFFSYVNSNYKNDFKKFLDQKGRHSPGFDYGLFKQGDNDVEVEE